MKNKKKAILLNTKKVKLISYFFRIIGEKKEFSWKDLDKTELLKETGYSKEATVLVVVCQLVKKEILERKVERGKDKKKIGVRYIVPARESLDGRKEYPIFLTSREAEFFNKIKELVHSGDDSQLNGRLPSAYESWDARTEEEKEVLENLFERLSKAGILEKVAANNGRNDTLPWIYRVQKEEYEEARERIVVIDKQKSGSARMAFSENDFAQGQEEREKIKKKIKKINDLLLEGEKRLGRIGKRLKRIDQEIGKLKRDLIKQKEKSVKILKMMRDKELII
jgi:hypothetical protein